MAEYEDQYQHLIHECQYAKLADTLVEDVMLTGMCGAQKPMYPLPDQGRPHCPDCEATIGTSTPCPGCGEAGFVEEPS